MGKRIFYLDNLRTCMIIAAIFCACSGGFMLYPPEHAYVIENEHSLTFDIFYAWCDALILPTLFFISGYFGASSLRIRLFKPFFKKKWQRIGLPWLFGSLVLAPELAYLSIIDKNPEMNFLTFYINHFWNECFEQGQFWFLGILLAFFLLLMFAKKLFPHCLQRNAATAPSSLILIGMMILDMGMIHIMYHFFGTRWVNVLYLFTIQPVHISGCILYFLFGIYAFKHRWFTSKGYCPSLQWSIPFALASAVYIFCLLPGTAAALPQYTADIAAVVSMTGFMGLTGIFSVYGNQSGKTAVLLTTVSYPMYFCSQTLIQNTAWLVRPLVIAPWLKFMIICGITLIYAYILSSYIFIRISSFKPDHYLTR